MSIALIRRRHFLCSLVPFLAAPVLLADAVEDKVTAIRALYNEIEGAKLRTRVIEFEAQDEPLAGTCTLHYQGDKVVKVHLAYGAGDHGASDEYFYYSEGKLFFAYASDGYWSFTGETLPNGESETIDSTTEHRVYVENGAVIRHLEKAAKSKNPEALPGLLAKAKNTPGEDTDRATRLVHRGGKASSVQDAAGVIALMLEE
ncbi:MAG: hypothetical protein JNJ70_08950 [Verrucomicrobiales bacterium]|nr:hypothetical protein [Verrucomicrobiales bacterium]